MVGGRCIYTGTKFRSSYSQCDLEAYIMLFVCEICFESFQDEILYFAHKELFHNSGEASSNDYEMYREGYIEEEISTALPRADGSVIRYAPRQDGKRTDPPVELQETVNNNTRDENVLTIELTGQALAQSSVRLYQIKNRFNFDILEFLKRSNLLIKQKIADELGRMHFLKFGLIIDTQFVNVENEVSQRGFITRNRTVMESSNVNDMIEECFQELILKITEHEARGSGWSLLLANTLHLRLHKHGYGIRGSSYISLPSKIANTKACINVKNNDNQCFRYAMLCKFVGDNAFRPGVHYEEVRNRYNFTGLEYPVSLDGIKYFEKKNPRVSVNVYGLDGENVYPIKVCDEEFQDHTDLLLIKRDQISHYVYIKDFNKLIVRQLTKDRHRITVCKRCLCFTRKLRNKNWLLEHNLLCKNHTPVKVVLPTKERDVLKFTNTNYQYQIPIVIYADFEASLLPIDPAESNSETRIKYQKHEPNSFCLLLKSTLSNEHLKRFNLPTEPILYRGKKASSRFVKTLYSIISKVEVLYKKKEPMLPLSQNQEITYRLQTLCYICKNEFTADNHKVRDHDHLTGLFRGGACNSCNINYKLPKFVPVVLHNLSGYDAHFIIPHLGKDKGAIDVLANTHENFISFSKKVGGMKLRFIDSYRFMPSSLLNLSLNLPVASLIETKRIVPDNKLQLVMRKGVFCYDYVDSLDKFQETCIPPKELFYSKLIEEDISEEDYNHACKVWNELGIRSLGEYSDFYVTLDVTLLCDVIEEFRKTCMNAHQLDPLHFYTSPGLSWQAMLKMTKCELKLLTDIDMLLMVESAIRGGITQSVKRYVKANNKHLHDYVSTEDSIYLGYFDANNLYGWAMCKPLPYDEFEWYDPSLLPDILSIPKEGDRGYIMEVDLVYPEEKHDFHYDFPFLPKNEIPPNGKYNKLLLTLSNKHRYVAHFWTIQQAVSMGLKLTKIHRVLRFKQSCWLKPYIDYNTARRAQAANAFEKDFHKNQVNSIFGKTLQNCRKYKNIRLVNDAKKHEKLVAKPNYKTSIIINENLVAVAMNKTKVKMNRPLYVGMSILDISKTLMYDFHYNKMVKYYGRDNIGIAYTDTDSFIYWIKTSDMYEDLKHFPYANDFDFSDYPKSHPNYYDKNKKVLGKFKDETNGVPLKEIVALMSKVYALKLQTQESCEIKKAKGLKTLYVKKNLTFEDYKQCLFEGKTYRATFNSIRSFNHQIYSITETKKALSSHDDKRHILRDGVNTLPHGHYSLKMIE